MMTTQIISHPELVSSLAKPGEAILNSLTPFSCHLLHMAMGVAGEAGELIELGELPALDLPKVIKEAGDLEFYLEGMRQAIDAPYDASAAFMELPILSPLTGVVLYSTTILDLVKKIVMYEKPFEEELRTELLTLIHHLDGYLVALYNDHGITRTEVLDGNIEKLSDRYRTMSFSNEQASARADEAG